MIKFKESNCKEKYIPILLEMKEIQFVEGVVGKTLPILLLKMFSSPINSNISIPGKVVPFININATCFVSHYFVKKTLFFGTTMIGPLDEKDKNANKYCLLINKFYLFHGENKLQWNQDF